MRISQPDIKMPKEFFVIQNPSRNFLLNNPRIKLGYTLIELLIVITIIVSFMSMGFAGYSRLNRRQKLIGAGESLKIILRDAQSRAFNREIDCSPGACGCTLDSSDELIGWYADFSNKKIYGACQGNVTFGEKNFGLSEEIVLSSSVDSLLFRYNPPGVSQDAAVCLNLQNDTTTYYIVRINKAGLISDAGNLQESCVY